MRGILFCVSFLSLCFGVLCMGDAAIAAPTSIAPAQALWGWVWFAVCLATLVAAPEVVVPFDDEACARLFVKTAEGWEDPQWPVYGVVGADYYEGLEYAIWPEEGPGEVGYDGIEVEHASARKTHAALPTITPAMKLQWERIAALRSGLDQAATYYEVFAIRRALAEAIRA